MKKLYEELTLEIIRFTAADIITASDAAEETPAKDDTTITFDANHEMAGKELNFRIELVEVAEA